MEGIRQFLSRKSGFRPKTQAQALAALAEGLVDESAFIWKGVNIHPVFEEPWDFNEIERLLAKEDLDLETTLLLMTIFERLIHAPDKEAALFAAESINAVERRFARRAAALREQAALEKGRPVPDLRLIRELLVRLAELWRDLGRLCFARPVLRRFYLREALAVIEEIRAEGGRESAAPPSPEELVDEVAGEASEEALAALEIGILLELGEGEAARKRIEAELALRPNDAALLFLAARSRYEGRDWKGVMLYLEALSRSERCEDYETTRDFWTRGACRD